MLSDISVFSEITVSHKNFRASGWWLWNNRFGRKGLHDCLAPAGRIDWMDRTYVLPASYVISAVGTSRCDVRAACSGATPSIPIVSRSGRNGGEVAMGFHSAPARRSPTVT